MVTELKTRDLMGVEILAEGRWNNDLYSAADLDEIAANFPILQGRIDPVGKLGHDGKQKLAQQDGYPAIGWVTKVYRQGAKLLADFKDIPARVADLIAAHAYDKVSSEVYFNLSIDGKTYRRVLKNVAFLGADMPAVKDIKSISDVAALYKGDDADVHVAEYADPDGDSDDDTNPKKNPDAAADDADAEMAEDDMESLLAAHDAHVARMEGLIAGKPGAKRVRTFMNASRRELAAIKAPFKANKESTDMETKKLAEMLGLPETATEADIEAAIKAKKDPPKTEGLLSEAEARTLRDDVGRLTRELAERNANAAVREAMEAKKLAPSQQEWAHDYALKDMDGFRLYVEKAPVIAKLSGPLGVDEKPGAKEEASDAERSVAQMLGTPQSKIAAYAADTESFDDKLAKAKEEAVAYSMRRPAIGE